MILLRRADLPDARGPTYQPTKCQATAATPINGNMAIFSFTMEIAEWEKACVTPAHFTEVDTLRGPSAALVKPDGSPLAS